LTTVNIVTQAPGPGRRAIEYRNVFFVTMARLERKCYIDWRIPTTLTGREVQHIRSVADLIQKRNQASSFKGPST
jgi:hypothetical protein